jgi:hypothetical protein
MAGLVMCRQGLERRPPGSDRVTKCAAGQTGECSNNTVTPRWYTERLPGLGAPLDRWQSVTISPPPPGPPGWGRSGLPGTAAHVRVHPQRQRRPHRGLSEARGQHLTRGGCDCDGRGVRETPLTAAQSPARGNRTALLLARPRRLHRQHAGNGSRADDHIPAQTAPGAGWPRLSGHRSGSRQPAADVPPRRMTHERQPSEHRQEDRAQGRSGQRGCQEDRRPSRRQPTPAGQGPP